MKTILFQLRTEGLIITDLHRRSAIRAEKCYPRNFDSLLSTSNTWPYHSATDKCDELTTRDVRVNHILDDGRIVSHSEIEDKLLELAGRNTEDFFSPRAERLASAYRERGRRVAFAEPEPDPKGPIAAE